MSISLNSLQYAGKKYGLDNPKASLILQLIEPQATNEIQEKARNSKKLTNTTSQRNHMTQSYSFISHNIKKYIGKFTMPQN